MHIQNPLNNLIRAHNRKRLASALLFLGSDNQVMKQTALELSHTMLGGIRERVFQGNHPNIKLVMSAAAENEINESSDETKHSAEIKIDQIRELVAEHKRSRFEDGPVFFIIVDAHRLTLQAANALLKTLEEPGKDKYIILLAPSKMSVLSTIRSRCQYVLFGNDLESLSTSKNESLFYRFENSTLEQRWEICQEKKWTKDDVESLIQSLQTSIHTTNQKSVQTLDALLTAQRKLRAHMNAQLVLEELLLKYWPAN